MSALTLALDIGGTKIAAGLVDPDGALVHHATVLTPDGDAETVWSAVETLLADTLRLVRANGETVEYRGPDASGVYDPGAPTKALIECGFGAPAPAGLTARLAARVVAVTDAIYLSSKNNQKLQVEEQ